MKEFLIFGIKQIRSCIFAGSFFLLLFLSKHIPLFGLARYDFLFLSAIIIQIILLLTKIETKDEVKMIFFFHIIGFILEVFKTSSAIASWSYPEEGFFKIVNVPLYSGFMYAAVGSYISQAWRVFDLSLDKYPSYWYSIPLCGAIYLNFFTHHFLPDFRWALTALVFLIFLRTRVCFTVLSKRRWMPLSLAFLLIGFFIWVAENISTFLGAWQYPDQSESWSLVDLSKMSSWFLLVIISIILVADLKHFKEKSPLRKDGPLHQT